MMKKMFNSVKKAVEKAPASSGGRSSFGKLAKAVSGVTSAASKAMPAAKKETPQEAAPVVKSVGRPGRGFSGIAGMLRKAVSSAKNKKAAPVAMKKGGMADKAGRAMKKTAADARGRAMKKGK
jgi:hypothetical protein